LAEVNPLLKNFSGSQIICGSRLVKRNEFSFVFVVPGGRLDLATVRRLLGLNVGMRP
jgi:hypothetical protein